MTESATWPAVERRRVPRLRTLLGGIILFDDRNSTMDCTVRSLSAFGAKVVLADAFRLPNAFNLSIPHHNDIHRAEVIWRRGDCAGLALSDVPEEDMPHRHHMTPREKKRAHDKEMVSSLW